MTVSSVPKFFGFSVVSGNYTAPTSKADCEEAIGCYEGVRDKLAEKLANILGKSAPTDFPITDKNSFYQTICKDICDDSVESNIAYKFYVNQIVKKINELDSYIKEAQDILKTYTDNKLTRLQLLDTFCKKIEIEFSRYYSYDPEEDVFKVIEECSKKVDGSGEDNINYSKTQLKDNPTSYGDLRNDLVSTYLNNENKKTIECFNELNLLDRLKYIKLYYEITSNKKNKAGISDALFPNDNPDEAYPAVSVPKSTAYNKETYTTGQLELFYIGYLVDRDGPIGALCSFIEFKSVSLLKNIEIESLRIKAINAYLTYLSQASIYLNGRQKDTGVPRDTYGIVALICNGFARGIKQLVFTDDKGNKETHDYIVLQRDFPGNTNVPNGYHLSNTGYYILVRVDAGVSDKVNYHADSPFIAGRISDSNCGKQVYNITDPSTGEAFPGVRFFQGFTYTEGSTFDSRGSNDFLLAHINNNDNYGNHKAFLPKELDITTIDMKTIYGISNGHWEKNKSNMNGKDDTEKTDTYNRMITSWQDAIDNYTTNLNTALESINSDIDVWRSKMNTWDGLANKIRHRDYEIRQNLMSRALR
ncbi:MAG: hypothetical protein ACLRFH_00455 [Opitutales bacterium]